MKDEEIIDFLKKDDNLMKDIKIAAHLNILEKAIIEISKLNNFIKGDE